MSDRVAACPECGTSSLGSSGRNYWCTRCCKSLNKGDVVMRERKNDRGAEPTRGLAAKLAKADPDEVSR